MACIIAKLISTMEVQKANAFKTIQALELILLIKTDLKQYTNLTIYANV